MNVASLELCKKLYELSKWNIPLWINKDGRQTWYDYKDDGTHNWAPAYDLGYLCTKMPSSFRLNKGITWNATYKFKAGKNITKYADTAENCTILLAIELFKSGVLKP